LLGVAHRVSAKGQVVIPKDLRDRADLHPGTEVGFALRGDEVLVTPVRSPRRLGGSLRGGDMAAHLLEDRRREPR
jgi:AbrB family looped-hinge helix DNA binding protein